MADDSKPRNPSDPKASASDAAQSPEARPELRIVGASEAGQLIANRSSTDDHSNGDDPADDDPADDNPADDDLGDASAADEVVGGDSDWMEVGDRTLAEVMGVVPADDSLGNANDAPGRTPALSIPFIPTPLRSSETLDEQRQFDVELGSGFDADDDLEDRLDDDQNDDDQNDDDQNDDQEDDHDDAPDNDVFPEEMYAGTSAARLSTSDRRFVPRETTASTSASSVGESAAPTRRKVVATPTTEDGDGWSSFAGSGPRWRDEAKDWRDVDAEDPSAFGDDQTRVGALDPERSGAADLYVFAEGDPRKSVASTAASSLTSTGAKGDPAIIKIDATKRSELDAPSSGSQQRTSPGGARPARSGSASSSAPSSAPRSESGSKNEHEEAPKRGRAAGLGERIVTGVGLALIVGFIFYIGKTVGAAVVTGLAVLLAALELANALKRRAFRPAIPVIGVGLIAVVAAGMFRGERGVLVAIVLTVISTLAWFLFGVERERPTVNIAATLLAFVYPGAAAACAALLLDTPHGTGLLMAAIVCTVGHDVFAYFCGRFLGRTKLATEISPNKTVEGLVGGMIGSIVLGGLVLGKVGWYPWQSVTHGLIVGFAVAVAAPVGDLIESQLKRDLDIKDMGSMLPGHGGVLDRIDGMLLAVPAVWLIAVALRLI